MTAALALSVSVAAWSADLPLGHKDFVPTPEQPIGWRGDGTGQYPGATPPIEWSETKNIVWRVKMPSWSNASPIVVGDRVFVTSERKLLLCFDAATGAERWRQEVDPGLALADQHHPGHGHFSATPTSDGKRVYVQLGCGVCAAYDLDGRRQWLVPVADPLIPEGLQVSSPLLVDGNLVVSTFSAVSGLDPATGSQKWTVPLQGGRGRLASPVTVRTDQATCVLTPYGDALSPSDGTVCGRKITDVFHATPAVDGEVVFGFAGAANKIAAMNGAVRLSVKAGAVTAQPLWSAKWNDPTPRPNDLCASPVLYEGLVCVFDFPGTLLAFDAKTGELKQKRVVCPDAPPWKGHGPYMAFASPCVASGRLHVTHGIGATVVYEGRDLKEVARNVLEPLEGAPAGGKNREPVRASLAFAGNRIFYSGATALYCIGGK